tara:strand:- start:467 stop:967 length:501 start_codon:yes stop_codon:yes gene_type:complete
MFKKIISTLFGGQEDNSDSSNVSNASKELSKSPSETDDLLSVSSGPVIKFIDHGSNNVLHIGAISEDIINPSSEDIEKSLTYLTKLKENDDPFAIFEVPESGLNFIQIYVESDYITFQYQDTNGIQYETKVKEMNDVIHVFQEFNMREIKWINNFKWEKLDILFIK